MKEKKSAEDLLMGSTLAAPGEGGIGNAIFVQGKTMGSRVSAGKRKLGPDPISHLQPITGQSAAGAVGVVDEEKMLSRIKAIVDESIAARDAKRDAELIESTVNATLTALLTPGSRHISMIEDHPCCSSGGGCWVWDRSVVVPRWCVTTVSGSGNGTHAPASESKELVSDV